MPTTSNTTQVHKTVRTSCGLKVHNNAAETDSLVCIWLHCLGKTNLLSLLCSKLSHASWSHICIWAGRVKHFKFDLHPLGGHLANNEHYCIQLYNIIE